MSIDWSKKLTTQEVVLKELKEKRKILERAMENHMDLIAQQDEWDNRWTLVHRASYPNTWQVKAIEYAQWMDSCWDKSIEIQNDVKLGLRAIPTEEELISELPVFSWS